MKHTIEDQWIMKFRSTEDPAARLFMFPYAGGGAHAFHGWQSGISSDIDVYAMQYPGRGRRIKDAPVVAMQPLVEYVIDAIIPYVDRPFGLFGHSMGALVCFEAIRVLQRRGLPTPIHFFASGCRAPQIQDYRRPIHTLPDEEFIKEVSSLNGIPKEIMTNIEMLNLVLPSLRADFAICEAYQFMPGSKLLCDMTIFGGTDDTSYRLEQLEAWKDNTQLNVVVHMLSGDHFFIHKHISFITRVIDQRLRNSCVGAV